MGSLREAQGFEDLFRGRGLACQAWL